jgi:SAM-dependent methyltransferase
MKMLADQNLDFYRKMKLEKFQHFAEMLGLDKGADIDVIMPYLKKAKVVAELGTGYGRALKFIKEKGFRGQLIAVERVPELLSYLKKYFPETYLIHQDIRNLSLPMKADVILWLWSGILEQDAEEQMVCVKKCYENLNEGGMLMIDIPHGKVHKVGEFGNTNKEIRVKTEWGELVAYFTGEEDIEKLSKENNFSSYQKLIYNTDKGFERAIYILKK